MPAALITDDPNKFSALATILSPHFSIIANVDKISSLGPSDVVVVDCDLHHARSVSRIRTSLARVHGGCRKIFLLHRKNRLSYAQACALGSSDVLYRPFQPEDLLAKIFPAGDGIRDVFNVRPADEGFIQSEAAFRSLFSDAAIGGTVDSALARRTTDLIIDRVSSHGLGSWLDGVRSHHAGTFQHCLLVTGIAVAFAMSLRFSNGDVRALGLAATLHDIGKAKVPISILDKPARLDSAEEAIMRLHPVDGHAALLSSSDIGSEALDCVLHHHEFLDGSGYPDRLKGSEISDMVRMLTISDIFAALIERRSYCPSMEKEKAYSILYSMDGKLEGALVRAFKTVAFSSTWS